MHSYPYEQLGVLKCPLRPHFAIVNMAIKLKRLKNYQEDVRILQKHIRLHLHGHVDEVEARQVLNKVEQLYDLWTDFAMVSAEEAELTSENPDDSARSNAASKGGSSRNSRGRSDSTRSQPKSQMQTAPASSAQGLGANLQKRAALRLAQSTPDLIPDNGSSPHDEQHIGSDYPRSSDAGESSDEDVHVNLNVGVIDWSVWVKTWVDNTIALVRYTG
jgi:hypothetical protein